MAATPGYLRASQAATSYELDDLISLADLSDSSIEDLSSDSSILVSEESLGGSGCLRRRRSACPGGRLALAGAFGLSPA